MLILSSRRRRRLVGDVLRRSLRRYVRGRRLIDDVLWRRLVDEVLGRGLVDDVLRRGLRRDVLDRRRQWGRQWERGVSRRGDGRW